MLAINEDLKNIYALLIPTLANLSLIVVKRKINAINLDFRFSKIRGLNYTRTVNLTVYTPYDSWDPKETIHPAEYMVRFLYKIDNRIYAINIEFSYDQAAYNRLELGGIPYILNQFTLFLNSFCCHKLLYRMLGYHTLGKKWTINDCDVKYCPFCSMEILHLEREEIQIINRFDRIARL